MQKIKYKYIIALFIIGFILNFYASLLKILHAPNADFVFKIAFSLMAISGILAVAKLLCTESKDSFLNK